MVVGSEANRNDIMIVTKTISLKFTIRTHNNYNFIQLFDCDFPEQYVLNAHSSIHSFTSFHITHIKIVVRQSNTMKLK